MTPVDAVRKLLEKIGWTLADVDLFELNEAFSVQAVAVLDELGLDPAEGERQRRRRGARTCDRLERRRVLTTLLYALEQRNLKRGIATLCLGGGNGVALAVERTMTTDQRRSHEEHEAITQVSCPKMLRVLRVFVT